MGTIRVTQGILTSRVLRNINQASEEILKLQDQLATGQRVNRPSDDPIATRRAINAQAEIGKSEQFIANISTIRPLLTETEQSMLTTNNILQRTEELTLQALNGSNDQPQLTQIANEIDQVLESLLNEGNQITDGRYIFGGTRTAAPPFEASRDAQGRITAVAYNGNDQQYEIQVSEQVTIRANETGQDVFQDTVDLFQTLIDIRDTLDGASGNPTFQDDLDTLLTDVQNGSQQVLVAVSRIGATVNRIDRIEESLDILIVQNRELLSDSIDADFAEVTLGLNAQSNAFQAALSAGARVIQPSLLDFVR